MYFMTTSYIIFRYWQPHMWGQYVIVRKSAECDVLKVSPFPWSWVPGTGLWDHFPFAVSSYSVSLLLLVNRSQMEHMNSLIFRSPTSYTTMISAQLLKARGNDTGRDARRLHMPDNSPFQHQRTPWLMWVGALKCHSAQLWISMNIRSLCLWYKENVILMKCFQLRMTSGLIQCRPPQVQ